MALERHRRLLQNVHTRPIAIVLLGGGSGLLLVNIIWQSAIYYVNGFSRPCLTFADSAVVQHGMGALWFVYQLIAAPVAIWLTYIAATPHLRLAALFAVVNWYSQVATWSLNLMDCDTVQALFPLPAASSSMFILRGAILVLGTLPSTLASFVLCFYLIWKRLDAMESSALESFSAVLLRRVLLYVVIPIVVVFFVSGGFFWEDRPEVPSLIAYVLMGAWISVNVLAFHAFVRAYLMALKANKTVPPDEPERARRAKQAAQTLHKQNMGAMLALFSAIVRVSWTFVTEDFWPFGQWGTATAIGEVPLWTIQRCVQGFDLFANLYFALALTGVLNGAAEGTKRRVEVWKERRKRWQSVSSAWKEEHHHQEVEPEIKEWNEIVHSLSVRGVSISELLRFYRSLGVEKMLHFDPTRHTTADVVYQAIIPMSAPAMCSGAEVLMEGKEAQPHKMVTHNWGNLFRDLVASIVADALGESDFSMVAVCAFSVNQHLGICNKTRRKDSVTGKPLPRCNCGLAKAMNDTQPTLPDGRGIRCEMNKFDDMMRYLSANNPSFEQVVAIDRVFDIFTRAWCIAEIAAASEMGMPQKLKVVSADGLATSMDKLKGLRIQDMEASRPEDKQQILNSIADHDNFNATLQRLLFEDLIPSWKTMDGEEQMDLAGQIIRWRHACSLGTKPEAQTIPASTVVSV